ncbi:hypothetical protein A4A49_10229 [Nicotiana attenuata]|uniref:Uncharacterized protein n=1 Tax=Nicotiana attenuata TaxID=49451 RepID=A0A314KQM0_NICAT|nr:hypothetical protein A4A49_10229 [Nicotiana attenuata]
MLLPLSRLTRKSSKIKPQRLFVNKGLGLLQVSNKFAALEGEDIGEGQNKQLAVVDEVQEVVNKAFGGNVGTTTKSCQDIPAQSIETNNKAKFPKINEKVQWSGGRLWANQIEEDLEKGEIPKGAQGEIDSTNEEVEDKDQSVNEKGLKSNTSANKINEEYKANNEEGEVNEQENTNPIQTSTVNPRASTINPKGDKRDAIDLGGTGDDADQLKEANNEIVEGTNAQIHNTQQSKDAVDVPTKTINTMPFANIQLKQKKMIGEQASRSLVPKLMQLAIAAIDDPGILAGKSFSFTS